jgi:NAD(P)-dependent dehydrogenase (short-subunit alcohol dehydrogenase family)
MTGIALITGGQQGIGLGIAKALISEGFVVAIVSLPDPHADSVTTALKELGPRAKYFRHDLRDIAHTDTLLGSVEAAMGPVTTLVSNAGVPAKVRGDMLDVSAESFDDVMGVNLRGTFFLAQAIARRMAGRSSLHYRSMTFITSISAGIVSIERAEYCISKAGASMMTALFATRLAPLNIGVFELRPGIVATGMTAGVRDTYTDRIESGLVPARRWGQPADIGDVMVPLATGRMAFATGAVIPVDGGLSIPRL